MTRVVLPLAALAAVVERYTGVDVCARGRHPHREHARRLFVRAARELLASAPSFPELGRFLGGRDHTTVMACQTKGVDAAEWALVERLVRAAAAKHERDLLAFYEAAE